HKAVGDEQTFHAACKAYVIQSCRAKQFDHSYVLKDRSRPIGQRALACCYLAGADLEHAILRVFGAVNNWGGSVSKPLLGLGATFLSFAGLYVLVCKLAPSQAFER